MVPTTTARRSTGDRPQLESGAADDLTETIGRLRRAVRRRVRRDWPHAPLPESELELIRLLRSRPGLQVQEAAVALGLAPNTVSTLVGRLVEQGLVDRVADERDRRVARLALTTKASRRLAAWRDRRRQVVAVSISRLDPADRAALDAALPALRRLVEDLEES